MGAKLKPTIQDVRDYRASTLTRVMSLRQYLVVRAVIAGVMSIEQAVVVIGRCQKQVVTDQ